MSDMNKDNLHISEQSQSKCQRNALTDVERIAFLERMLASEECLNEYIDELTSSGLDPMPAYLEEEILESISVEVRSRSEELLHAETQTQTKARSKHSVWLPLLGYSVKIGFAAACAILMLFHLPDISDRAWEQDRSREQNMTESSPDEREERAYKRSSYAADALEFITSKIFDGGIKND